jgi:hypothetical protein
MPVVRVGQQPQLVYNKAWGPGCITNTDETNPVYVSINPVPDGSSDQIPPLGALAVDGSQSYYASTFASYYVALQSMPGTTSWAPSPAQIAAQILLSGISLVNNADNVVEQLGSGGSGVSYLNGNSNTYGPFPITGLSWELAILSYTAATGANAGPFVVNIQFWDPTGMLLVGHRTMTFWPGETSGQNTIIASGPTRGAIAYIVVNSYGGVPSDPQYISLIFSQSSRTLKADSVQASVFTNCASGVTLPGCNPPAGIIASAGPALAAGNSAERQLPLWLGQVNIGVQTTSGTSDASLNITVNADESGIPQDNYWNGKTDANGNLAALIALPSSQCTFTLTNHNAGSQTLSLMMISDDSTVT